MRTLDVPVMRGPADSLQMTIDTVIYGLFQYQSIRIYDTYKRHRPYR